QPELPIHRLDSHALQHLLDMRDRRLGQEAMAEIENERSARESFENSIDAAVKCRTTCEQRKRIEITLHRNAALHLIARERLVDHPVEPNRIEPDVLHITRQ